MPAKRIEEITKANATFLAFVDTWDRHRHDPEVADFAFGNPQEIAVDGFAQALAAATKPTDKHHYEYKALRGRDTAVGGQIPRDVAGPAVPAR